MQNDAWQPIDTAPRDGTIFLIYCAGTGWINTGEWDGFWRWHHLWPSGGKAVVDDPLPTHWMPLPSPPK